MSCATAAAPTSAADPASNTRDRLLQAKLKALDTLCAIAADLSNPTQARLAATQILKLDPSDLEPAPEEPQPSPRVTSKDIQHLADALHASTAALVMSEQLIPPCGMPTARGGHVFAPNAPATTPRRGSLAGGLGPTTPLPPHPPAPFETSRASPAANLIARAGAWP